jgi:hypothetical protein
VFGALHFTARSFTFVAKLDYQKDDDMMTKDEQWIHDHFEELVDAYAGRYVAVANEELFVGDSPKEVEEKARQKYPNSIPSVLGVPHPEDFICAV